MRKKIVVTGGSGFIGTNLIRQLVSSGVEVLNLDLNKPRLPEQESIWKSLDLCDFENMKESIVAFKPDIVIHLGARTDLNGKTLEDYNANTIGVKNLLEILDLLPGLEQVLFASSMYVCRPGYTPAGPDDYHPHTVYGQSKVETEKLIKSKNPEYRWTIIRPTSIWGPYFGEPYNLFFKIVLSGRYFHLGSRACKKTYGYIDNFIYELMAILAAARTDVDKKTFYLGDYEPYDITSWANEIATQKGIKIPRVPFAVFQLTALFGDMLKFIGLKFPMTSFRLKNMTTDNVYDLTPIKRVAGNLPVSRIEGTKITIDWLDTFKTNI